MKHELCVIALKLHFVCYNSVEYKILSAQKHCKTHQKNGAVMCQSAWEIFTSTNKPNFTHSEILGV